MQHLVGFTIYAKVRSVLRVDSCHGGFMFVRQRLCERLFHGPFEGIQRGHIVGTVIVVHDTSVFKLIGRHDRVVTFIEQLCSMNGLVPSLVTVALFCQNGLRNAKSNPSIDASPLETSFGFALLGIRVEGGNLVSEKAGGAGSCVRNEGFLLRKMELEFFTQKYSDPLLDFLCF